jgi:hypothetical protein
MMKKYFSHSDLEVESQQLPSQALYIFMSFSSEADDMVKSIGFSFLLCSLKNFEECIVVEVVHPSVSPSVHTSRIRVWPITSLFELVFLQLFHRNDRHKRTCREHLGRYLEGQGHSMTLQQNCVRPITLLF